jgi:hypothetical protein
VFQIEIINAEQNKTKIFCFFMRKEGRKQKILSQNNTATLNFKLKFLFCHISRRKILEKLEII